MQKTALEIAQQAVNFNEIDQSKIPNLLFRYITAEDLDQIYAYPEITEALVPLRGDREDAEEELIEYGGERLAVNQDTGEIIFCLGTKWSRAEMSLRYLYFYQGQFCTFIDTDNGYEMSIFYQSPNIDLDNCKKLLTQALTYGGYFFFEAEYIIQDWKCDFDFIESKDLFVCHV